MPQQRGHFTDFKGTEWEKPNFVDTTIDSTVQTSCSTQEATNLFKRVVLLDAEQVGDRNKGMNQVQCPRTELQTNLRYSYSYS